MLEIFYSPLPGTSFRFRVQDEVKLFFIVLLIAFHLYCGKLVKQLAADNDSHSEKFYRLINEIPVLPLIIIIIMAVVRPF